MRKRESVRPLRIGLITTLATNIGDDLIREGVYAILGDVFAGRRMEFVEVNKHLPTTVYPTWHPVRLADRLPRGRGRIGRAARQATHNLGFTRFDGCDLIVQCGAPVLWHGCANSEWARPLWHEVVGRLASRGVPVLNLAAGSSFAWEQRDAVRLTPEDAAFLRASVDYCRLTTARDTLARRIYSDLGSSAPLIRCAAFLAGARFVERPTHRDAGGDTVLINYMRGGGHYDWNQGIDGDAWENSMCALVERLTKRHSVAFICHDDVEYAAAARVAPGAPRYQPRTPAAYFELARRARVAICNRLHASVGLAGVGVPSLAIGTDTRLLMVEALSLPVRYVKDAAVDDLESALEGMMASRADWSEQLRARQHESREAYFAAVSNALAADRSGLIAS